MNFPILTASRWPKKIVTIGLSTGIVFVTLFAVLFATAHTDGRMRLSAEEAGPYKLTVWTSPEPVKAGELHITLAVVLAEDASPVLDAAVTVNLSPENGGERLSEPATTEDSANKFLYEAVFDIAETGTYQVDLQIVGADGSHGESSFDLEVSSGSSIRWLYLVPVILIIGAIILLFLALRGRSAG